MIIGPVFAGVDESSLRSGLDLTKKRSPIRTMVLLDGGLEFKKNKNKIKIHDWTVDFALLYDWSKEIWSQDRV